MESLSVRIIDRPGLLVPRAAVTDLPIRGAELPVFVDDDKLQISMGWNASIFAFFWNTSENFNRRQTERAMSAWCEAIKGSGQPVRLTVRLSRGMQFMGGRQSSVFAKTIWDGKAQIEGWRETY